MADKEKFDEICVKTTKVITTEQLKIVGKNIKRLRLKNKLTQQDIGFFIFSDKSLISALERNVSKNITLLTLIKIAEALKVKVGELFLEEKDL